MTHANGTLRALTLWCLLLIPLFTPPLARAGLADQVVELKLVGHDIAHIAETGDALWLQLTQPAAKRLADLTTRARGHRLKIAVDGIAVFNGRVRATINSGVIRVDKIRDAAREHLEALGKRHPG